MEVFLHEIVQRPDDEHHVDKGRHQRQQYLEDGDVGQRHPTQRAFALHRRLVFPNRLHDAEGPAEALPHQPIRGGRSLGVGQGTVFIVHPVAGLEQRHRQVSIFGNGVVVISTGRKYRSRSPCADRAGNDAHRVQCVERAAFEVLAGDIFQRLPAGPEIDPVAHLGIARHGSDAWIGEVRHQL